MKALTIRQPWAHLIIHGTSTGLIKDIENRDWLTKFRGRVAIHSSATVSRREYEECEHFTRRIMEAVAPRDRSGPMSMLSTQHPYLLGCVIGTVEIVDCVRSSSSPWFCGEYGFVLRNPIALAHPIPAKGKLSLWEWEQP